CAAGPEVRRVPPPYRALREGPAPRVTHRGLWHGERQVREYPGLLRWLRFSYQRRRLWAASRLAELGPAARPALPALRLAADDGGPVVRRAAAEALKKVEGQGPRP